MVIMAIYVEKDLIVSRYLFFQGNGPLQYVVYSSNLHSVLIQVQVEYVLREFNLGIPQQAFEFLFQLYNFVSTVKTTASELDLTKDGTGLGEKSAEASNPLPMKSLRARNVRAISGTMRMIDGVVPNTNAKKIQLWIAQTFLMLSLRKDTTFDQRKKK
jgi:hypothetical protein